MVGHKLSHENAWKTLAGNFWCIDGKFTKADHSLVSRVLLSQQQRAEEAEQHQPSF